MKKILLPTIMVFMSITVFSQVGINTSQPTATLDIRSKGADASTKALKINNSASPSKEIITILDNGNVGINNSSPQSKLSISTSTAGTGFTLSDGTQGNGRALVSDANGNAKWAQIPIISPIILPNMTGGRDIGLSGTSWYYTGTSITIPGNSTYAIQVNMLMTGDFVPTGGQSVFMRSCFSDTPNDGDGGTSDVVSGALISGVWGAAAQYGLITGFSVIKNSSSSPKTYYYKAGSIQTVGGPNGIIYSYGGNSWSENGMYAIPVVAP